MKESVNSKKTKKINLTRKKHGDYIIRVLDPNVRPYRHGSKRDRAWGVVSLMDGLTIENAHIILKALEPNIQGKVGRPLGWVVDAISTNLVIVEKPKSILQGDIVKVQKTKVTTQSKILAKFISELPEFMIMSEIDGNYNNMGATIIDGILQSGINYKTVVKPRVKAYLAKYSDIKTTLAFKNLIDKHSISKIIDWKESAKTERINRLTDYLIKEGVDTELEFKEWLESDSNIKKIKTLHGIKDKTADYFRILTGCNTSAIDRHLIGFLHKAGIAITDYMEAQKIISDASKILGVEESYLDHSIWTYMSELNKKL